MSYDLRYTEESLGQLVAAHAAAADRGAVVAASLEVDGRLSHSPKRSVDVLADGLLAVTAGPLRVYFVVHETDRVVRVEGVKLLPGHAGWSRPGGASGPQ